MGEFNIEKVGNRIYLTLVGSGSQCMKCLFGSKNCPFTSKECVQNFGFDAHVVADLTPLKEKLISILK